MLGVGLALLAAPIAADNRCSGYQTALTQLRAADAASATRHYVRANRSLDAALKRLGGAYAPPGAWDHTDMHLLAAWDQERQGHLVNSARVKRRILLQRIHMCRDPRAPRQ
jgi:hypothetical protein